MGKVNARRRGDVWQWQFEGASINGHRKQYSHSGYRTKGDALKAGTEEYNRYIHGGLSEKPEDMSVADFLHAWVESYIKENFRPQTYFNYERIARLRIDPVLGKYRMSALTPLVIQKFFDLLAYKYADGTIRAVRAALSSALSYAVVPCGIYRESPLRYVRMPKSKIESGRVQRALTGEEFKTVLESLPDDWHRLPYQIAFWTGMRRGEVLGLTWDDVDLVAKTISVRHIVKVLSESKAPEAKGKTKTQWYLGQCKTRSSYRTIAIGDRLAGEAPMINLDDIPIQEGEDAVDSE